jgi:Na+/H+-dicarboxylate symporter
VLAIRTLLGLVCGFLLGLAVAGNTSSTATATIAFLAPIGTIFINLIRMTVVPLVVSMLIASVGAMTVSGTLCRTGLRALVIAVGLLAVAALASALVAAPVFASIAIDRTAALALQGPSVANPQQATGFAGAPTVAQWLVDLVPQNIVKAAADGAMVPLIIFAVLLGLALTRVTPVKRDAVLRVVEGVAEAMQRIIGWILQLAPIGVFALAVPLASRLGLSAAGTVVAYVILVVVLTTVTVVVMLYPLGILAGPLSMSAFVAYCAPSQAIAFASRSSLATLPVMVQSAERAGLSSTASGFVLPLALSAFHFGAAVAQTVGVVFLARLFGVTLTPPQIAAIVLTVVFVSFAVPGIPGGSIIAMVPVLAAAHVPIEGLGILLAVDTIPDMFRTTANVTGALTLAAMQPSSKD